MTLKHHVTRTFLKSAKAATLKTWQKNLIRSSDDIGDLSDTRSCLVVAPHPDDETLGCGATILRKRNLGTHVVVVICTDGRHSGSSNLLTPTDLVKLRTAEVLGAGRILGLECEDIIQLGYEDGTLETNEGSLSEALAALNDRLCPDEILVTCLLDEHPDHRVASRVIRGLMAAGRIRCRVAEYPISFWAEGHWLHRNKDLPVPRRLWNSVRDLIRDSHRLQPEVVSTEGWLEAKQCAISAHQSQTTNLTGEVTWTYLEESFLANFLTPYEIFFPLRP
jgi:LmbE family N-acetylglucosaminyl deacetylase